MEPGVGLTHRRYGTRDGWTQENVGLRGLGGPDSGTAQGRVKAGMARCAVSGAPDGENSTAHCRGEGPGFPLELCPKSHWYCDS